MKEYKRDTILVVDDQELNRKITCRQLKDKFQVVEAGNGKEALKIVDKIKEIAVILLDLSMPVMDGFEFMVHLRAMGKSAIPVIVMTASNDEAIEERALQAGAIDFVVKPVNYHILMSRIENAVIRNQMVLLQRMEFIASHDSLTNLYNRNKMFEATRRMLDANPDVKFAFVRFDIDKFRLFNSAMGEEEGNRLLTFIADAVRRMSSEFALCTYGRIDADVFCMCEPYQEDVFFNHVRIAQQEMTKYREDYALDTSFGVYVIDDNTLSVETIFTRASLAADKCKNLYDEHYAFYDKSMSEQIFEEQEITNDMKNALDEEQFQVYLQPKYDLNTDLPCGAEALVRWAHPLKGLISPGKFIPVFEKNGFIASLDYYMWEHVCILLHKWLGKGGKAAPVSVNMSRVSLFNRHVDELLIDLVKKYEVPPELLNLEITESAYMSDPEMMTGTIERLQKNGFIILMDDFGSGYSSLNTLKQINIDVLKLDMKFLPDGRDQGKSEKIISSVVRMAGWLGMDVIAEGVETLEQKQFLESIGCGFVQGYYYAKPMPVDDYEELMKEVNPLFSSRTHEEKNENTEAFWSVDPHIGEILASIQAPVAIMEYSTTNIEVVRMNQAFQELYGSENRHQIFGNLAKDDVRLLEETLEETVASGKGGICDFSYISEAGSCHWIRMKAQKIAQIPKSAIICSIFEDITREKVYESKLRQMLGMMDQYNEKKKLLIVDDLEVSRAILRNMFETRYEILEAENGKEGLEYLNQYGKDIAAVLLDLIMPQMGGEEFLAKKNKMKLCADIPVVVISSETDAATQLGMLKNGVNDYIVKPFDLKITQQRVENAMTYQSRFKQLVDEYRLVSEKEEK